MKNLSLILIATMMTLPALAAPPERARVARRMVELRKSTEKQVEYDQKREHVRLKVLAFMLKEAGFKIVAADPKAPSIEMGACGTEVNGFKNGDQGIRVFCELKTTLRLHVKTGGTCSYELSYFKPARAAVTDLLMNLAAGDVDFTAPKDAEKAEALRIRVYDDREIVYRADGIFREERETKRATELLPSPIITKMGEWEGC